MAKQKPAISRRAFVSQAFFSVLLASVLYWVITMYYAKLLSITGLVGTAFFQGAQSIPALAEKRQSSLDTWTSSESTIAINDVLANIGSDGSKVSGAAAGVVVASPSQSNPNCELSATPETDTANTIRLLHVDPRCCSRLQDAC